MQPDFHCDCVLICGWRVSKVDLGHVVAHNFSLLLAWCIFIYV